MQCNSVALISFVFFQCKTAVDVDTCHVILNISQLLPSVLWNRKFSDSNIVFQGRCPFPLLPCKTANGHFFLNSLPSLKLPHILRWENFLKFRPMNGHFFLNSLPSLKLPHILRWENFWNLDLWYIVGLIFKGDSTGLGDRHSHWFSSQR